MIKIIYTFFFLLSSSISYSAILNVSNGQLIGASGVDVNGVSYDVAFIDGTCADLYNGCDQNSDFTFSNPLNDGTLISQAMNALLEQVLIDSSVGAFDSNPALTIGCNFADHCQINTPLFVGGSTEFVGAIGAFNTTALEQGQVQFLDHITAGSVVRNSVHQIPKFDAQVFADWSPSAAVDPVPVPASTVAPVPVPASTVAPVPVPAVVWLLGSGLIGLIGMRKKSTKIFMLST